MIDARLALLLACFFLSGFAALLYQTAWTRELSFVFGTSELAVAAVLAAYMGGLALGAAAAARWTSRLRRPVLAYGVLELAIALCALSVPLAIRGIHAGYVALLGGAPELPESGTSTAIFQLATAFAVLLPPTAFMGATLPLLARHAVRREAEIGSRVGLLYAVNTAGAIAGTLCAAFLLMPEVGLRRTVWTGAGLNGVVFGLAALLARGAALPPAAARPRAPGSAGAAWILPALAVSGAVSFAYEVLWTRLLGHLIGGSVQGFASMLASFLTGIALGSTVAARLATSRERAAVGFAAAQLGIAVTAYGAFALADRLPALAVRLGAGPSAPLAATALAAIALLPITLCIGTTFPFAVRLLARHPDEAAAAAARAYAWNTVGAIAGALAAGFALLPAFGFEGTLGIGVAASLALAAGTALLAPARRARALAAVAAALGAALLAAPPRTPWLLLRASPMRVAPIEGEVAYAAVGRSSTVLVLEQGMHLRLYTNGLPEAGIERAGILPTDTLAHWLGMLPSLVRPQTRELLVIGLGGGSALEFVPSSVASIDVIELEPEVLAANRRIAAGRAIDPLADPRVRVHIGDARGALSLTAKRYDAIVSQPSHPWTAGASHLYTREFFSLVRERLAPGGVFAQWIAVPFVDEALLRALVATLLDVFPHLEAYQFEAGLLFVVSDSPLRGVATAQQVLRAHGADYARFGIHGVEDIASHWVLDTDGARAFARGAPLNTDDHNLLAARTAGLGDAALDVPKLRTLIQRHDPLRAEFPGVDRAALIRRLVTQWALDRAEDLAVAAEEDVVEERGLGWLEIRKGRSGRAVRHFERAFSLAPGDPESLAGLVASRRSALIRGVSLPELPIGEADLDGALLALVLGWRAEEQGDWDGVAALDAELAEIEPWEPLFEEAASLRCRWRLATGDPAAIEEVLPITERALLRDWAAYVALLRAQAAVALGRTELAWATLQRFTDQLPKNPGARPYARRALELAAALPEERSGDLIAELERRVGRQGRARRAARAAPVASDPVEPVAPRAIP